MFCEKDGAPQFTLHAFGRGRGVYLSGFRYSPAAARMLMDLLAFLTGADRRAASVCDHPMAESAWFPADNALVVFNNAEEPIETRVACPKGDVDVKLEALETRIMRL